MDFGEAIRAIKRGKLVRRDVWVPGTHVRHRDPVEIVLEGRHNVRTWSPTNGDLLADDWLVVDGPLEAEEHRDAILEGLAGAFDEFENGLATLDVPEDAIPAFRDLRQVVFAALKVR